MSVDPSVASWMPVPELLGTAFTLTPGVCAAYACAQSAMSGASRLLPVSLIVCACAAATTAVAVRAAVPQAASVAASAAAAARQSAALRGRRPRRPSPAIMSGSSPTQRNHQVVWADSYRPPLRQGP